MDSLYKISRDFEDIFMELEDNGGELTDELASKLQITEDNFKEKVSNYVVMIKKLEQDEAYCKCEKDRISRFAKTKSNAIKRLKESLVEAINNYGDTSKSGTKYVDFGTGKVSVASTTSVEIDDDKVRIVKNCFTDYLEALYDNAMLEDNDQDNFTDVVNEVNNRIAKHDSDPDATAISPVTADDLDLMNIEVKFTCTARDLALRSNFNNLVRAMFDSSNVCEVNVDISKTEAKRVAKETSFNSTIVSFVENKGIRVR